MANLNKVEWLLSEIENALTKLHTLAQAERDTFLHSDLHLGAAKYFLQTAIEACLQISQHLIETEGYRTTQNRLELFAILSEHQVLPEAVAETLKPSAEFQQVLIYRPWEVAEGDVHHILQNHLTDFEVFIRHIRHYLNPEPTAE